MSPRFLSKITPASRSSRDLLQSAIPLANALSENAAAFAQYAREYMFAHRQVIAVG
jgi:hypothetical protein